MADVRTFEEYFQNRPAVAGPELQAGDEVLALRGGTVQRKNRTYIRGVAYMEDNAVETVIDGIDAFKGAAGTMLSGGVSASLAFAANAFTYSGPNQTDLVPMQVSLNLSSADLAADVEAGAALFVNDVQVNGSMTVVVPTGSSAALVIATAYALQTGDVIDLRLRNRTNTENLTLEDVNWLVG